MRPERALTKRGSSLAVRTRKFSTSTPAVPAKLGAKCLHLELELNQGTTLEEKSKKTSKVPNLGKPKFTYSCSLVP